MLTLSLDSFLPDTAMRDRDKNDALNAVVDGRIAPARRGATEAPPHHGTGRGADAV